MAPGELREGLGGAFDRALGAMGGLWDGPRTSRGGHERFELTFFSVWGPSGALSLRFSMFWCHRTL